MFGFWRKPVWTVELSNEKAGCFYQLESDSLMKMVGYIAKPLEDGFRPPFEWIVAFRHSNGKVFRLWPAWPDEQNPIGQIFSLSREIDSRLIRVSSEPAFYRMEGRKKRRMDLHPQIDGAVIYSMSLEDRIAAMQGGKEPSMSFYGLTDQIFTTKYDPARADDAMIKEDPI